MHALLLAVALTTLALGDGHLTMSIPPGVHLKKNAVNFETEEYDLYEGSDTAPLLTVIDGGGAYDLSAFKKTCLNSRPAWIHDHGASGTIIMGEPGSFAVAAYWTNLKGSRLSKARAIASSIRINFGAQC